jgi:pimeloyl-ACP methyl ester carboxylesterase
MANSFPQALSLNVSPSFRKFDRPLLKALSQICTVGQWDYRQNQDEPCSLEIALVLLQDYLKSCPHPIHLVGHGTAGLLGLLYARRYPERVKSLTLLSVGVNPAVDWQAHYYVHRQLLPCSQEAILAQMAQHLFGAGQGKPSMFSVRRLMQVLAQDLIDSPSPHNLFSRVNLSAGPVAVPLLVCGGAIDSVVDSHQFQGWQQYFKTGDRLWLCPQAGHFFQFSHSEPLSQQIQDFWQKQPASTGPIQIEPVRANSAKEFESAFQCPDSE